MTFGALMKRPSAFAPVAMSLAALVLVGWFFFVHGTIQQEDEGTAARIFQLLLAAQIPILGFFLFSWLPRAPRQALQVLAIQVAAASAAVLTVFVLEQ